jgi:hypothetical protein
LVEALEERRLLSIVSVASKDEFAPGATIIRTETMLDRNADSGNLKLNGQGLEFTLTPASGMAAAAIAGFQEAADLYSGMFSDDIMVNIDIDFTTLGAGILGQAGSTRQTNTYTQVTTALATDQSSADDTTAVGNLPAGSSFDVYINRTSNSPNGSGSATPYVDSDGDANNTTIRMTTANAKALGLLAAGNAASDASITFSDLYTWDFDRSNGITAGAY